MKLIVLLIFLICLIHFTESTNVYHLQSNDNYVSINKMRYRESISINNKAQFIFSSNDFNHKTNAQISIYEDYSLYQYRNRWNENLRNETTLFTFYIATNKTTEAYYAHNIILEGVTLPSLELRFNNKIIWSDNCLSSNIFIPLESDDKYINVELKVYKNDNNNLQLKSWKDNGYQYGATSWIWYKEKEQEIDNYEIDNIEIPFESIRLPILYQNVPNWFTI